MLGHVPGRGMCQGGAHHAGWARARQLNEWVAGAFSSRGGASSGRAAGLTAPPPPACRLLQARPRTSAAGCRATGRAAPSTSSSPPSASAWASTGPTSGARGAAGVAGPAQCASVCQCRCPGRAGQGPAGHVTPPHRYGCLGHCGRLAAPPTPASPASPPCLPPPLPKRACSGPPPTPLLSKAWAGMGCCAALPCCGVALCGVLAGGQVGGALERAHLDGGLVPGERPRGAGRRAKHLGEKTGGGRGREQQQRSGAQGEGRRGRGMMRVEDGATLPTRHGASLLGTLCRTPAPSAPAFHA